MEGGGGASGPASNSKNTGERERWIKEIERGIKEREEDQREGGIKERERDRVEAKVGKNKSDKFRTLATFVTFLDSNVRFEGSPVEQRLADLPGNSEFFFDHTFCLFSTTGPLRPESWEDAFRVPKPAQGHFHFQPHFPFVLVIWKVN